MRFDEEKARRFVLNYCSHYIPSTATDIAVQLKENISDFYPKTDPTKLQKQVKTLVQSLITTGFLVKYTPSNKVWKRAREMATKGAQRTGGKVPRNIHELYQTNFLYVESDQSLPIISLPKPKKSLNFEMCVLMHKFKKPENYTWEMLNLLMCASDKRSRDDMRIHLYVLPLDYNEIELLEQVLEFGEDFKELKFPFRPDINEAKGFISELAVGK